MPRRVREADKETRSGSDELLDTFIERSVIVPALVMDIGRRVWWPSRLSHVNAPAS